MPPPRPHEPPAVTEAALPPTLPFGEAGVDPAPRVGRFEVVSTLGQGGMGAVYAARDPELDRVAAVKVVLRTGDPEALRKFVREARLTGSLEHPGIPPVHELGRSAEGHPYYAMKRVEGCDLAAMLAGEADTPDLPRLLAIFGKVCDAVAFAHARGVLHRDLKPANIMVGAFGEVLVMDWGLARVMGDPSVDHASNAAPAPDVAATHEGEVMGTPAYMSPEQAAGANSQLDARSDVYALGAVLYEVLAGVPPYVGKNAMEVLLQVLEGPPPVAPSARAPERTLPWELDFVVARAMARDPAARYPTAQALKADVDAYLDGRRVGAARYGAWAALRQAARRHRHLVRGTAAVVVVALGIVTSQQWRHRRDLAQRLARAEDAVRRGQLDGATTTYAELLAVEPRHDAARARLAQVATAYAERRLAGVPAPDELCRRWQARQAAIARGAAEGSDSIGLTAEQEAWAAAGLETAAVLDRSLAALPDAPELRALRVRTGMSLGYCALLARDYALARHAFASLAAHGVATSDIVARLADVEADRSGRLALWRRRVSEILLDVSAGMARAERAPDAPTRDDYQDELAAYRHPAVASDLATALKERVLAIAPDRDRNRDWAQSERDVAILCCRALGRLELAEAVPPLTELVLAVRDVELVSEGAIALCRTRRAEAFAPVASVLERLGAGDVHARIAAHLWRLPMTEELEAATATSLVDRGVLRFHRRDWAGARSAFDQAIAEAPEQPAAYAHRAALHAAGGDLELALADLDRAVALAPDVAGYCVQRARLQCLRGELALAIADCDRALGADPANVEARLVRARARRGANDLARALADVDAIAALDPYHADAIDERSEIQRLRGDAATALADAERAIAIDTRCAVYYVRRGLAKRDLRRLVEALSDFEVALRIDPRQALAYKGRGTVRWMQNDHKGALADYSESLRHDNRDFESLSNRGLAHAALGRPDLALPDFERAVALAPRVAALRVNRANILISLRRLDEALADLELAVELDPRLYQGWATRGVLLGTLGRKADGIASIRRALDVAPPEQRPILEQALRELSGRR